MGESDEVGNALTATVIAGFQFKILDAIIRFITIAMMNVFVFCKQSAQVKHHYQLMFTDSHLIEEIQFNVAVLPDSTTLYLVTPEPFQCLWLGFLLIEMTEA